MSPSTVLNSADLHSLFGTASLACISISIQITRGQWPYRPAATYRFGAIRDKYAPLGLKTDTIQKAMADI